MGKFIYKFEPIKKVKETQEKEIQKEISILDLSIRKLEDELKEIKEKLCKSREETNCRHKMTISEIQFTKKFEQILEIDSIKVINEIAKLNQKKNGKLMELIKKVKEHRIFEKLEDIHKEAFDKENNKLEQIALDEMAINKYRKVKK